jgi:hypothetical protein
LKFRLIPSLLAAASLTLVASPAFAQYHHHPEAGHAQSDLRAARALLVQGGPHGVGPEDQKVISLLDAVISQAARVSEIDGRGMHLVEAGGVDATTSAQSRHENVRILLETALNDLNLPEDNPSARPYLQQARYQLGEAITIVRQEQTHRH